MALYGKVIIWSAIKLPSNIVFIFSSLRKMHRRRDHKQGQLKLGAILKVQVRPSDDLLYCQLVLNDHLIISIVVSLTTPIFSMGKPRYI